MPHCLASYRREAPITGAAGSLTCAVTKTCLLVSPIFCILGLEMTANISGVQVRLKGSTSCTAKACKLFHLSLILKRLKRSRARCRQNPESVMSSFLLPVKLIYNFIERVAKLDIKKNALGSCFLRQLS